jgi:hypothetical protein
VGSVSVTTGTGIIVEYTVSGGQVTVNLSGVADAQRLTLTLSNVNDGTNAGNVALPMAFLLGDTNASGAVNATDIGQTKSRSGEAVTATNFRSDVVVNGMINSSDIGQVKAKSGSQLPP